MIPEVETRSWWSTGSIASVLAAGSIASIACVGSIVSAGSIGSIASLGSVGSIASVGRVGAVFNIPVAEKVAVALGEWWQARAKVRSGARGSLTRLPDGR